MDLELAKILAQGKGSVHGIDGSDAMIAAANELCKEAPNCTFEGTVRAVHVPADDAVQTRFP